MELYSTVYKKYPKFTIYNVYKIIRYPTYKQIFLYRTTEKIERGGING